MEKSFLPALILRSKLTAGSCDAIITIISPSLATVSHHQFFEEK
ncbi:MAG: hypothetical protein QY302_14745 [Anaerolineales bacterium]|nr:MAG: hypothetical protein QY302_14745 [Anaerolineales bacterium]